MGQKVRYDGGDKKDDFLTETFGRHVDWVPVCPEVEIGMGIPREAVRLDGDPAKLRMIAERSGKDWTPQFDSFAAKRVQALTGLDLAGYIFKKNSASCGMERVRVYNPKGVPTRQGRGLFAAAVMSLVDFHTRHKFLLLAHSERHHRKLGRIVAEVKQSPITNAHEDTATFSWKDSPFMPR